MKIAIIGGGAAGIMASITAKRLNKNIQIDIFDANKSIGKKILASGNGRCNISNTMTNCWATQIIYWFTKIWETFRIYPENSRTWRGIESFENE